MARRFTRGKTSLVASSSIFAARDVVRHELWARAPKTCLVHTMAPNLGPGPMSYLHCPTCKCAYNIAQSALCPNCPVPASEVDPTADIVAAAEQLAHAMARATPSQRKAATARMDVLALPAPGAVPVTCHGAMLRSIRQVVDIAPPPPPPGKPQPLLAAIAYAVVERITDRIHENAPRLMERIPSRLRRAGSLVRARMRALAA